MDMKPGQFWALMAGVILYAPVALVKKGVRKICGAPTTYGLTLDGPDWERAMILGMERRQKELGIHEIQGQTRTLQFRSKQACWDFQQLLETEPDANQGT